MAQQEKRIFGVIPDFTLRLIIKLILDRETRVRYLANLRPCNLDFCGQLVEPKPDLMVAHLDPARSPTGQKRRNKTLREAKESQADPDNNMPIVFFSQMDGHRFDIILLKQQQVVTQMIYGMDDIDSILDFIYYALFPKRCR